MEGNLVRGHGTAVRLGDVMRILPHLAPAIHADGRLHVRGGSGEVLTTG